MALQMVSPVLSVLGKSLSSPIMEELGLLWGVGTELEKLTSTVSALQSVLDDAEEKQLTSNAIADWLLKLKDAAYDADDILDEWATDSGGIQQKHTTSVCTSLLSCICLKQIKFRHKIAKRMKELNQRFSDISVERSMFNLREGVAGRTEVDLHLNRMTGCIPTESKIYGRDGDKAYILEWLCNNINSTQNLSIRSILGIGGLGKTTLAQAVFNDDSLKDHFYVKIWVCVSNDFDLIKLTRAVLEVPSGSFNSEQLAPLQRLLQDKLSGKRFLLVLDDVWNEDQEEWSRFKSSLECGAKGSSILVTTRLQTVASMTGTCPHYPLQGLSEDDCWALFKHCAFGDGNEERPDLVKIGKAIVQKCGGVPLAAKILGGLLRFSANESKWLSIRDSNVWDLAPSSNNTILPALKLSYNHLSPHLRQCFAFCSIYRQDFHIKKEEVINLWMANGLLQQEEGKQMEDIGEENVESLVWKSLFQVVERDEEGYIKTFAMHDLVHDLACSVAKNECCNVLWSHQQANVPNGIRHLLVSFYNTNLSSTMFRSIHQTVPKLRTIILNSFVKFNARFSLPDVRSNFKCVRALKVEYLGTELPGSIGNLKHLRYLDLSFGQYKHLPESICGLRNLQTLKLNHCPLEALPKRLSNLRSLRHLDISGSEGILEMPMGMGKMTCLQTLSMFIVGSNKGQSITELERMENLGGELKIKCLEKVRSRRDAECAKLLRKKRLRKLTLEWSDYDTAEEEKHKEVIEGLQPDSNLRRLHIENYQGIRFPSWLEYSILPNLLHITLSGCRRCEALPHSFGRLPFLKKLEVRGMPLVKTLFSDNNIDSDVVSRFPSLESLQLRDMHELEKWCSFEEQMFMPPSLKHLTIKNIPKLTRLPSSPSLKTLIMRECNEMVLGSLVKNLPCLFHLEIEEFNEVVSFPEGSLQNLTALEFLHIRGFKKLKILPREVGELSKLVHLEVEWCDELVSLPQVGSSLLSLKISGCESLTNLRGVVSRCQTTLGYLDIYRCPKLEWSSLESEHLNALESLHIGGFSEMTSLPEVIRHLSSTLQTLTLNHLNSLSSLPQWIGSLTQLRYLSITICMELTMLPDELRHLTNLHTLYIQCCHSELHTRCKSIEGEDWDKISHIPKLIIGADDQY